MKNVTLSAALAAAALAALASGPSHAAVRRAVLHHAPAKLNCGWPHPDTGCAAPKSVTPAPSVAPVKVTDPASIISAIINAKAKVVSDLQQADTLASTLNTSTGASWDAYSHMCLAGVPAMGTQGQPGYVPATPGLIDWITNLQAPSVAAVPPLPDNPSAATVFVHARLLVMAAQTDVSAVVNMLQTTGIPSNLKLACGSLINDVSTQALQAGGQLAAFDALLVKFAVPAAIIP